MRSDFVSFAARGDQPAAPGHLSLNQFYIGSDDVNEHNVDPKRVIQSLNTQLDEKHTKIISISHGSEPKSALSSCVTVPAILSARPKSADQIKVVGAPCLTKPSAEQNEPLGSTTLSSSNDPGLAIVTNTLPPVATGTDRQVAFHSASRMGDFTEDAWRDSAPNGGWGWLVVFGSFLCVFVVDGVCFSYGMHMRELIVEGQFDSTESTTISRRPSLAALSLPGALLCGTNSLIGPIAGALLNRFDYRCVAMVGALLVTTSFTISALWIYDLSWFTVVFGVFGGVGFGLIYLPAITVVGHWFEQRRAFVVGVAMCGGGLGCGVLAALIRPLAHHVAWRGTLLLTGALLFQTLLGIALFRPLCVHEMIQSAMRHKRRQREARHQIELSKKLDKKKADSLSKHSSERKTYFQRGSIMARIIEEKSRQRTTSTGSLDGMVITRENELVALPDQETCEAVMAAATAYVMQQQRQQQQQQPLTTSVPGHSTTPMNESSPDTLTASTGPSSSSSTTTTTTASISTTATSAPTYNRTGLVGTVPSGRGPGNLQTVKEGVAFPSHQATVAPVAVLPPPVHFTRTAVRRIARAILRKLHSANLLPSYLSLVSTTNTIASRNRVSQFYNPLAGDANRTESWTAFDAIPPPKHPMSEHTSVVYDTTDPDETLCRDVSVERKLSLITGIGMKKFSLRTDVPAQTDLSAFEVSKPGVRERRMSRNVISSRPSTQIEPSWSPSQLASMVSLDSRTDRLISRELYLLPVDTATKEAVLIALRKELSRPKYRVDFFHSVSRKPSSTDPELERRKNAIESGTHSRMLPTESQHFTRGRGFDQPSYETVPATTSLRSSSLMYNRVIGTADTHRISRELPLLGRGTLVRTSDDQGQRLRYWLSDPTELNYSIDETLAYLREMLDWRLLCSVTFLVLILACSLNMLVLLVPFHFLPLLLEFGGMECQTNPLWCPEGLPSEVDKSWLAWMLTWSGDWTTFVSPGAVLLTIGLSSIVGRLLAAMYIEKRVGTGCRPSRRCPCLSDPLLLNNALLVLCAISLACFPLSIHGVIVTPTRDELDRLGNKVHDQVQAWTVEFRVTIFFIASILYGLASAMSLSLRSVILVDLFGIRRLTNAFGHLLIFQGLAVIVGPPLFGYFCDSVSDSFLDCCDLTGSVPPRHRSVHNNACVRRLINAFYICAALFLLTSLLFAPLRWIARHDPVCRSGWPPRCCARATRGTPSSSTVFPCGPLDPTLTDSEIFPMGTMHSPAGAQYDPQQTQTTQILSEIE